MSSIKNKNIAVIGGGPAGLSLAKLLQLKNADVKVYERDLNKDVRVQGATLDLHDDSGLKALREAGLMEAFKENYRPGADLIRILDKDANIVFDEHSSTINKTFEEAYFRPEIDRGPLRKILLDSLAPGTVIWDSQFISLKQVDDAWEIKFKNGTTAKADIVVTADGANSTIRSYITSIKPFYSGITVVEGSVYNAVASSPKMHELLKGGKIFAFGNDQSLIVSSKGDGSLVFYTGAKTNEDWIQNNSTDFSNRQQVIDWFKKDFSSWDDSWLELYENAALPLSIRPQYCMPLEQTWEALPNLTMLGDAAHLMPPYAGEGVNMAMLDALELSDCLTDEQFTDTKKAIANFENKMRERASAVAQITLQQTDALHSENAISSMLELFGEQEI